MSDLTMRLRGNTCFCADGRLAADEIERLRAEVGHWREANRTSLTVGDVLKDEVARLTAENDWLRAYTAQSAKACVYCGLGADEQGECNRGFPGCARADDQMLCREVEVAMERDALLARVEAAEKNAGRMREFLLAFINGGVNQDFRLWASKVLSDMEGGKC